MKVFIGLIIPFLGTMLGSSMVFLMKDKLNQKLGSILSGFAGGVMVAASIWSLMDPSIKMAEEQSVVAWIPAAVGFALGTGFLLLLDNIVPHLHYKGVGENPEGPNSKFKKTTMMVLAVTLHNIPEGMAIGVALAGLVSGVNALTTAGVLALSIGVAIQNFPEGTIISMPLKEKGVSKGKAFLYGTLSGIVEPIGGLLTFFLTSIFVPILPYMLSFAAGAMMYVVVEELVPESQNGKHSNLGTMGFAVGFILMMVLDVALG